MSTYFVFGNRGQVAAPEVRALLQRAFAAHGGNALEGLRTVRESAELVGSAPLGMRMPSQKAEVYWDRAASSGRWEGSRDGKLVAVYQQTPAGGVVAWTETLGTRRLRAADAPFAYVPLNKTGILGLVALRTTADALTYVEKGEIKGKKGPVIVRAQAAPVETLLLAGKGEMTVARCQTAWAYLFAPDGTLIAERITQTETQADGKKRVIEAQMSFDRFATFGGVKFPTEVSVKNNQIPSMVRVKLKVTRVTVNAPLGAAFKMP
jgi:hypothetical protein